MPGKNPKRKPQAKDLRSSRKRLADAIVEIITNKTTPTQLQNSMGDFVMETTNGLFDEMRQDSTIIERALERLEEPTAT